MRCRGWGVSTLDPTPGLKGQGSLKGFDMLLWFLFGVFVTSLTIAAVLAVFAVLDSLRYTARHGEELVYDWARDGL